MKQITLPNVAVRVEEAGETRLLVLQEVAPAGDGDIYVVPMPVEVAEAVAKQLSAPHIAVAPANALAVVERGA